MRILKLALFAVVGMSLAWLASVLLVKTPEEAADPVSASSRQGDFLSASTARRVAAPEGPAVADAALTQDESGRQEALSGSDEGPAPDSAAEPLAAAIEEPAVPAPVPPAVQVGDSTSAGSPAADAPWVRATAEARSGNTGDEPPNHFDDPTGGGLPDPDSVARITCEFGPGLSGGVQSVPTIEAEWAGGRIDFDNSGIPGKVVMRGTVGATSSLTGESELRVDTTPDGLHFSGPTPRGNFILVSLFNLIDGSGDYVAIMSRHQERPFGLHTAVFSGACRG